MASSSNSESDNRVDKGKESIKPKEEGVLKLEDHTDSIDGLFHWQMSDYELFPPSCNMLEIEEDPNEFHREYKEYKKGEARVEESPAHQFPKDEHDENPKTILVGDDWNPVLKTVTFKIFTKYTDVFAWTYKDLKGVPLKLCVH